MSDPIPCRVCGCIDGEPSFCHAILIGKAWKRRPFCYRLEPDRCVACDGTNPNATPGIPELAALCEARAHWAENAASFRGTAVPGAYQLRRHAAAMRIKARRIIEAGNALAQPVQAAAV